MPSPPDPPAGHRLAALLAEASHELSNPLAIVSANAEMLTLEAEGTPFAPRAATIRDAADRAAGIARRLLAAVREEAMAGSAGPAPDLATAPPSAPSPPAIAPARAGRTALVVDDEIGLAEALADLLTVLGYTVIAVGSGQAAQAVLLDRGVDLIVSDLRMPGIDGQALYRWIGTARPELQSVIAFSTGDTLSADAARFLGEAGRPFMEKPFTLDAVRALVATVEAGR